MSDNIISQTFEKVIVVYDDVSWESEASKSVGKCASDMLREEGVVHTNYSVSNLQEIGTSTILKNVNDKTFIFNSVCNNKIAIMLQSLLSDSGATFSHKMASVGDTYNDKKELYLKLKEVPALLENLPQYFNVNKLLADSADLSDVPLPCVIKASKHGGGKYVRPFPKYARKKELRAFCKQVFEATRDSATNVIDDVVISKNIDGIVCTAGFIQNWRGQSVTTGIYYYYKNWMPAPTNSIPIAENDLPFSAEDVAGFKSVILNYKKAISNLMDMGDCYRFDFIIDKNGKPWFLEVNFGPHINCPSLITRCLEAKGLVINKNTIPNFLIFGN